MEDFIKLTYNDRDNNVTKVRIDSIDFYQDHLININSIDHYFKETLEEIDNKIAEAKNSAPLQQLITKKTIFELTLQECRELMEIATDYKFDFNNEAGEQLSVDLEFIVYAQLINKTELSLKIDKNLDAVLWQSGMFMFINNQLELQNRLQQALNKVV